MGSQQLQAGFASALASFPSMHPGYASSSAGPYFLGSTPTTDPMSYSSLGSSQAVAALSSNSAWQSCNESSRQSSGISAECAGSYLTAGRLPFQSQFGSNAPTSLAVSNAFQSSNLSVTGSTSSALSAPQLNQQNDSCRADKLLFHGSSSVDNLSNLSMCNMFNAGSSIHNYSTHPFGPNASDLLSYKQTDISQNMNSQRHLSGGMCS